MADRFRRIVSSSAASSSPRRREREGLETRKKWEKGGKAMCKGVSRVELSHGGDTETSLSGAETTGPRTSRGPDSTLALFSLSLSIYLSLSLTSFFIVSHSPCSRTTLSAFLSPRILVSLKVHPDRIGTSLWSLTI